MRDRRGFLRFVSAGAALAVVLGACSADKDPVQTSLADPSAGEQPSSGLSGSEAGGPGDATGDEPTGGPATSGDATGGPASREVCDDYLDCLAVVAPTELPAAQQGFGPEGT